MSKEIKRMSITEFRDQGFLQEVNRLFFHPMGMALEVEIDDEDGTERLGGVWDYRDDPEGMYFGEEMLSKEKAIDVKRFLDKKSKTREEILGYIIQPID